MNDDLGENREHLRAACEEAVSGDALVDLGVRAGYSSRIMLESTEKQQCRVIGVDVSEGPAINSPRYSFLNTDSVTAARMIPAPLFLVFFDTLHIKEQVMTELFHYWPKIRVGGCAVFHDSQWPPDKHDFYLGREWGQVIEGIDAFFGVDNPNVARTHFPDSWGMTFVQKLTDWNPIVEGMDESIRCSKALTDMLTQ